MTHLIKSFLMLVSLVVGTTAFTSVASALAGGPSIQRSTRLHSSVIDGSLSNFDYTTETKLPWVPTGYKSWSFRGHKVNYLEVGGEVDKKKPPLLLIHGFGASVYHWRYNVPELAKDYHVYAIDQLGFGLSEKPIIDYTAELWRDQTLAFIKEVIKKRSSVESENVPCVVAGNSLGGFTALYASADASAEEEKLINGCILINAAGRFKKNASESKPEDAAWIANIKASVSRFVIGLSFIYTKQPMRIEQVLKQVYPVDSSMVDAELVDSIQYPAQDPNAPEVFYRVIAKNGSGPPVFIDDLLKNFKVPLLLLWGMADPWIRPSAADSIEELFPSAVRVNIDGGHCVHDECPGEANKAIADFMQVCNKS